MKYIKLFENWGVKEDTSFMYDVDNLANPSEEEETTEYAGDFEEKTPEDEEEAIKAEYDPYDYESEEAEEMESEEE